MTHVSVQDVSAVLRKLADSHIGAAGYSETGSQIVYADVEEKTLHIWANDHGDPVDATDIIQDFIDAEGNASAVASFVNEVAQGGLDHHPTGADVTHNSSDGSWKLEVDECPQEISTARINFTVLDASE
jgi:hypothetical protein